MATIAKEFLDKALEKLNILRHSQREIILKKEQQVAIEQLLLGNDVLAVLPTGFGKSMIFTVFLIAKQEMDKQQDNNLTTCILVISPLASIISEQIYTGSRSLNQLSRSYIAHMRSEFFLRTLCKPDQSLQTTF